MEGTQEKRGKGRPAQPYPKIPDTFENVIKALVSPVKKPTKAETDTHP